MAGGGEVRNSGRTRRAIGSIAQPLLVAAAVAAAILVAACGSAPDAPTGGAGPTSPPATAEDSPRAASPSPSSEATPADVVSDGLPGPGGSTVDPAAGRAADEAYVPESSIDAVEKRLNVTVNGETVYIKNGGQVVLGDGLVAEIFVDPYPPSTLRSWLDIYLTKDGEPVTGASIGIEYDMLAMLHGPFWGEADKLGGGHYLFTLDYIMFGAWDQFVTIRMGLERIRFPVVLVAYP